MARLHLTLMPRLLLLIVLAAHGLSVSGTSVTATQSASNRPSTSPSRLPTTPSGAPLPNMIRTLAGTGAAGFAGDGGPATSATLLYPAGIATDASGNVFVANSDRIRMISIETGLISTVAGNGVAGYSGDGGPGTSASLNNPYGVAISTASNRLFLSDTSNHRIRLLDLGTGVITTVAGDGVARFGGDGGPAVSASLYWPHAVAVNSAGDVFISDAGNIRIRMLTIATGIITTVAGNGVAGFSGDGGPGTSARLSEPYGVAVDAHGHVLIADHWNQRIRKLNLESRIITTVAGNGAAGYSGDGGPGTSASLSRPFGLAVDSENNILIVDQTNHRVRRVAAATGIITTLAGNGAGIFSGDGGPPTSASLYNPAGVVVDTDGSVIIADHSNHRIRILTAPMQRSTSRTPTPSSTSYCQLSLFRSFPRMDLVGTLVGTALSPSESVWLRSEDACRQACCDAALCDGYSFDADHAKWTGGGGCFLLVNISQLVPNNGFASGMYLSRL